MGPDIYKVSSIGNGNLYIMAKPTAGEWLDDEFDSIRNFGITNVVSMLEKTEAYSVGLQDEEHLCNDRGIKFTQYQVQDRGIPSNDKSFSELIENLHAEIFSGDNTVIHCRAGIGRAGLTVAAILIRSGIDGHSAFDSVSKARRVEVPDTQEQKDYILNLKSIRYS